jgi:phosphatidylserine/phosphatidylglycerophosphate/cardiolipin synthase-like enzyme
MLSLLLALASPSTLLSAPVAHAEPVQLFLNDPVGRRGPANQCEDAHCKALLDILNKAESKIEFAVYGFRDQSAIINALLNAQKRGVKIRGIVDMNEEGVNYYSSTESVMELIPDIQTDYEADRRARQNSRPYNPRYEKCERPNGFDGPLQCLGFDLGDTCLMAQHASREEIDNAASIMHNKFFIVDNRYVWTGSTNVSDSGTGGYNANLVTLIDAPQVAAWFLEEFEQMYTKGRYHDEKQSRGPYRTSFADHDLSLEVMFSPQDKPITNGVIPLIQQAKSRIDVGIFFLTHKVIAAELMKAHQRGVKVRVILDATAAKNGYTKHELLREVGIPVKIENWGGKMHMKSGVIDGKHVITGSMNWTSAGEGGNDENTVILHSEKLARQYEDYFDKLWDAISDNWLKGRPDPESMNSAAACFDGVDNDFDHLADKEDPGCSETPPALPALPPHQMVSKASGEGKLVKGVVTKTGEKFFFYPNDANYSDITVSERGLWFCSDKDAKDDGFKRGPRYYTPDGDR